MKVSDRTLNRLKAGAEGLLKPKPDNLTQAHP
jgi:hypothetical protein